MPFYIEELKKYQSAGGGKDSDSHEIGDGGERRRLGGMDFYVNPALKAMGAPLFAKEERG